MPDFDLQDAFDRIHDKLDAIREDVTAVTTHVHGLVGNGQPGKIQRIEDELKGLHAWKNRQAGMTTAISGAVGFLGFAAHFLWDAVRKH